MRIFILLACLTLGLSSNALAENNQGYRGWSCSANNNSPVANADRIISAYYQFVYNACPDPGGAAWWYTKDVTYQIDLFWLAEKLWDTTAQRSYGGVFYQDEDWWIGNDDSRLESVLKAFYVRVLGRSADAGGLAYFKGLYLYVQPTPGDSRTGGSRIGALLAYIMASRESLQRITRCLPVSCMGFGIYGNCHSGAPGQISYCSKCDPNPDPSCNSGQSGDPSGNGPISPLSPLSPFSPLKPERPMF